jgi:hypothetical protein
MGSEVKMVPTEKTQPTTPVAQARHTPGPWGVWSSLYEGFKASVVSGHAKGAELKTLAHVRKYRDAVVMAAAPELLGSLTEISDMLMSRPDMVRALRPLMGPAEHAVMNRASAAIAKATGTDQ